MMAYLQAFEIPVWAGVISSFEFRSFIIFCSSKVTGKIASSLLGRRDENPRERRRK